MLNLGRRDADESAMDGNTIEEYDLDALVRRFRDAETRAYTGGRVDDAADFLIAQHLVCILRGDFVPTEAELPEPDGTPLRLVG